MRAKNASQRASPAAIPATEGTSQPPPAPGSEIRGSVERITFQNEETGYTVARVQWENNGLVTVVGNMPGVVAGEVIVAKGVWDTHPEHGSQFKIFEYHPTLPATVEGIRAYLGSGLVKGVGPVVASRIVDRFGISTFDVIESDPNQLSQVSGVGAKRIEMISRSYSEHKSIKEVMVLLSGFGLNPSLAVRVYKAYGEASVDVVRHQPYRLAQDVWGIGFKTADKLATALGLPPESTERAQAGLTHSLSEAADDSGHSYLVRADLVARAQELLQQPETLVEESLEALIHSGKAAREVLFEGDPASDAIFLMPFYRAELGIARGVERLLQAKRSRLSTFESVEWERAFGWLQSAHETQLSLEQAEAAKIALTGRVTILTGGPGTGKTTAVRSIVRLALAKKRSVLLAAPTGRAAKRLSELTGLEAKTIHRLLGLKIGGSAQANAENQLDADLIVVDEASMLDLFLANSLLKAVPTGAHLLLVGDVSQLPAVGAGNVLSDLIDSDVVPTVRLETIFRQAESSAIVTNAHRINSGEMPRLGGAITDFYFLPAENPEESRDQIVKLVTGWIPERFNIPPGEIQVLSPMHRGESGVGRLNELLQAALNPPREGRAETRIVGRTYRVGDRVIALRNDYKLDVYNGDLGLITRIDTVDRLISIELEDGRLVDLDFARADELSHSWAMSVHKAQGSEFRAVVIPMLTTHYPMLVRNLVYTAITRARELVVLVGQKKALAIAVRNDRISRRNSGLAARLRGLWRPASTLDPSDDEPGF